jgi:hypothetical protein
MPSARTRSRRRQQRQVGIEPPVQPEGQISNHHFQASEVMAQILREDEVANRTRRYLFSIQA